ncbi:protein Cep89 homolog [Tribolium madens]|uniref:protein Cep89 homolog n=1 Tax=Tribolium madens TaxID=41895 RepID=UPI001CF725B6|nr:protein Cep89 homolog [Tribolium madens]
MSFFFNISTMSTDVPPLKPRRKKLEVPVHKTHDDSKINLETKKTYSANFHSKRYKNREDKSPKDVDSVSQKVSRRYLSKENTRLVKENEEIVVKFNELEEMSVRKILKLKEKISVLQNTNDELSKENIQLKDYSQDLLTTLEDLKLQFEINKHCQKCEESKQILQKVNEENTILKTSKKNLEEDLNMLKTVVYRLNVQMERYQEKLRKLNVKVAQNSTPQHQSLDNIPVVDGHDPNIFELHKDHSHTPISWGKVNSHTLGPLLDAYQDTITEKDEIIESYEAEIFEFTGKLKDVIKENDLLHKSLTEDNDCSSKLKIELDSVKQELKDLRDQNDILIKKCALKQDKLEEVLKCYEYKVEQMKRDYSVVHDQYCKSRTEVTALKEKNKALLDAQDEFKNERQNYIPLSVHTSSVNECKKWYEELKHQYEQEKIKLKENIEVQAKQIEDFEKKISQNLKEKEELENMVKHLEKQIKKGEAKYIELEHNLSEVQFAKSACKKQLNKAMNFAKDLVAEQETLLKALNQRQQENKAVKKIGCDIATRMDTLRNQLKDVQRGAWQELSTVEKRIQDQNEAMETMKQEHIEEIDRLQRIIKEQESNMLLKDSTTLPVPHYLLFRDKHK